MAFQWTEDPGRDTFHPRLEPVSAWLFRRNSPYLRTGGAGTATLFSMPVNPQGFRPDVRDSWRALRVENPATGDNPAQLAFTPEALDDLLSPLADDFDDPRVFVLPLREGAALTAERLRQRTGIGSPRTPAPSHPLPEPTAIVGIIDHGINIFHERFRHRTSGTRIAAAWMQGAVREADRLPFGREWLQADVEEALTATGGDEDSLLRLAGDDPAAPAFSPLSQRTSHGTHVLDVAAGFDPQHTDGDTLPIIAVSLPPVVTRETAGSMLALPFALGLEYIADRARRLMRQTGTVVPVIVNFSLGLTGGPRNGLHRLEQTIARVAERHRSQIEELMDTEDAPFTVVVAAGNNNLSQGHARSTPAGTSLGVNWQLQPGDPTANFLEIRLSPEEDPLPEPLVVTLGITPPGADGPITTTVFPATGRTLENIRLLEKDGAIIGRLSVWRHPDGIAVLTLALDGTDPGHDLRQVSPPGTWEVSVSYTASTLYRIDAWVLRDDVPVGFTDTGRQSYFTDPDYRARHPSGHPVVTDEGPSVIRRAGSLNAIATATDQVRIFCAGALSGSDGTPQPATYSATPLDDTTERVDISAPGDRSPVRRGVLAAGTRSGSRVAVSGTSVAAPQMVRHLATGAGSLNASVTGPDTRIGQNILSDALPDQGI
ncbi:S8 family serine peptidase [uncultured Roseobacter sp.]|uniref:S8 family serine peptidase n=1 Tax=uncultured Roseobacter sp. TaxID=114847 RepID=UPI002621F89D|nr:S8 family serine peptidase [uncultured Roseobacter sp.]